MDEWIKTHAAGTSFGNTLMRRYLQSTQWIKNPTSEDKIKKFNETADFFKKYSSQYGFDYLMVVAQGYQESMLEQSARSPGGAVGIMQVKPSTAAAAPINIPNVMTAENNIHAGVKVLKTIADQYFNDPKIDPRIVCFSPLPRITQAPIASPIFEKSCGPGTGSRQVVWQCRVDGGAKVGQTDGPVRQQYLQVLRCI